MLPAVRFGRRPHIRHATLLIGQKSNTKSVTHRENTVCSGFAGQSPQQISRTLCLNIFIWHEDLGTQNHCFDVV